MFFFIHLKQIEIYSCNELECEMSRLEFESGLPNLFQNQNDELVIFISYMEMLVIHGMTLVEVFPQLQTSMFEELEG